MNKMIFQNNDQTNIIKSNMYDQTLEFETKESTYCLVVADWRILASLLQKLFLPATTMLASSSFRSSPFKFKPILLLMMMKMDAILVARFWRIFVKWMDSI